MMLNRFWVKRITNQTMLNQARSLLYRCYIQEMGWIFPKDNPSGLCFRSIGQHPILVDDYDKRSTWFLLCTQEQPIGTMRVCYPDTDNLLEIERYSSAKTATSCLLFEKEHQKWVEINREAILPEYISNQQSLLVLLRALIQHCHSNKLSVLTSCYFKEWYTVYSSVGFYNLHCAQFKYSDQDDKAVDVFFVKMSKLKKILSSIDLLLSKNENQNMISQNYDYMKPVSLFGELYD